MPAASGRGALDSTAGASTTADGSGGGPGSGAATTAGAVASSGVAPVAVRSSTGAVPSASPGGSVTAGRVGSDIVSGSARSGPVRSTERARWSPGAGCGAGGATVTGRSPGPAPTSSAGGPPGRVGPVDCPMDCAVECGAGTGVDRWIAISVKPPSPAGVGPEAARSSYDVGGVGTAVPGAAVNGGPSPRRGRSVARCTTGCALGTGTPGVGSGAAASSTCERVPSGSAGMLAFGDGSAPSRGTSTSGCGSTAGVDLCAVGRRVLVRGGALHRRGIRNHRAVHHRHTGRRRGDQTG